MLHMGLEPLVLSATTSRHATYAACSNASNLESIFDLHHAELNETMGLAQGKQFWKQSQHACDFLSSVTKTSSKCQERAS